MIMKFWRRRFKIRLGRRLEIQRQYQTVAQTQSLASFSLVFNSALRTPHSEIIV
jgi:hypothetical protein